MNPTHTLHVLTPRSQSHAQTPTHPACLDIWTDAGSIAHLILGWIAGSLPASQALTLFVIFTGYQISQTHSGESWPRVGGELLEFGLGMLAAQFMEP